MRTASGRAWWVVTAAVLVLASGCGGTATAGQVGKAARPAASGASSTPRPVPGQPGAQSPSLPPGDPGVDAPAVPDPGAAGVPHHEEAALRRVPGEALLDATDVGSLLDGSWTESAEARPGCTQPPGWVARRTVGLAAGDSALVETVSTHRDAEAADAAVAALRVALPDCGWQLRGDPRLGSASLSARRGPDRVTVVASEGVSLVISGRGPRVAGWGWAGLVDVAFGTSCGAAAHGCH